MRQRVNAAAEAIMREKDSTERAFASMRQTIVDMRTEKGFDPMRSVVVAHDGFALVGQDYRA